MSMIASTITFSQRITGRDRKAVAAVVAEAAQGTVRYAGAPSFAYEVSGWAVDKNSVLHSPELTWDDLDRIRPVFSALSIAGLATEGDLTVRLKASDMTDTVVTNLRNLISSKRNIIMKALQSEKDIAVTQDEAVSFLLGRSTLNPEELTAYIMFAWKLADQAKAMKRISPTERSVENEKYAFRCFLLRLGFIGSEYKEARKVLLERLEGNSAFKSGARRPIAGNISREVAV
jgi:hypothetical protein